ncbi:MAG: T9SS type A sorting domain-containing protein [Ignavibacteriae bacterium]|nr:T9SS C-terminal target domain-containing protein [Ignavibacteriota bacterium]NOG98076.1 T9SS type A sorting domain-containing protein [Ignavibacteriota bacterium]
MNRFFLTVLLLLFHFTIILSQNYWEPADSPDGGNIQHFAVNSQDHIFGGCFDGLFKSTDNGESWMQLSPVYFTINNPYITAIGINNLDEIFVATNQGGISKSTDNGETWQNISGTLSGVTLNAIAVDASNHIFTGSSFGAYKSTDNGQTWMVLPNFPTAVVNDFVVDDNGVVIAGTATGVYESTDGGDNWTEINTNLTNQFVTDLELGPSSNKQARTELFAATTGGVFRYDRVLNTWIAYLTGLTILNIRSLAINSLGDLFAGTPEGVFVHYALATTWVLLNIPDFTTLFVAAIIINSLDHIFIGEDWGGVHRSIDNGVTWTKKSLLLTAYAINLIFYSNVLQTLFLGTNMGFWSLAVGGLWSEIAPPFPFFHANIMAATVSYLFVATTFGSVWRLTRSTGIWAQINNGLPFGFITSLVINSVGHLFIGTYAGVFRSTNDGDLWEPLTAGITSVLITSLVLHPLGYLFAGTQDAGIFKLDLTLLTWTAVVSGLTTLWVTSLTINSLGVLFAATSGGGVFRSNDVGLTWTAIIVGLTYLYLDQIIFRRTLRTEAAGEMLTVGGGSIFKSTDDGDTWVPTNSGINGSEVYVLGADSSGNLFAGTRGGGLYQNGTVTSIKQLDDKTPDSYSLYQNFPNPFNPSTTFSFGLSKSGYTELKIYNSLGEVVETLVNKELPAGNYNFNWDAGDMPSGVYFYRLNSGKLNQTKKAILIK